MYTGQGLFENEGTLAQATGQVACQPVARLEK